MLQIAQRFNWVAGVAVLGVAVVGASPVAADVGPVPAEGVCVSVVPSISMSCPQASYAPTSEVAATQSSQASPQTIRQFTVSTTPQLARALLMEVNRTRRQNGLQALTYSASLAEGATAHVQALATTGQFMHAWPTSGAPFGSWIRGFYPTRGFRFWTTGENLVWSSPGFSPASAVSEWLASPTHRRVMLTRSWRELGIGVVTAAAAAPGAYGGRDVQIAAAEFGTRRH